MNDPILIVGAGPTGLTAAMELTRMGLAVRLVDRAAGPATTSRAIGVQARTLELFEQRGLAEEMVQLGNRGLYGSIYGGGSRVFHLDFAHVHSPFPYLLFISQAETERILREACAKQGVTPEWNTELLGIQQNTLSNEPSPVHAVLKHEDGTLEHVATPWMISSEGAHSLVRSTLDLSFEGHTREESYALGDVRIDGDLSDTDFHIFSSPNGFMGLFPMGGDHFRLIASHPLSEPKKGTAPSLEEIQAIYDQRSHIPARFHDQIWSSWFRINSRMISRPRVGRLFLGGDAAHIHSPAGAQGMNTGIQDMINLSWKLAMVENGTSPDKLLDTYAEDRLPVMRGVLFRTDHLTDLIGSQNTALRAVFNHVGPYLGNAAFMQKNQTAGMSQIALEYRDSSLSANHRHGGAMRAGDRIPPIRVKALRGDEWKETSLLSVMDPSRPTLLVATTDAQKTSPALTTSKVVDTVEIAPADGENGKAFSDVFSSHGDVVLARPDGYAGMTSAASHAPDNVRSYLDTWFKPN